MKWREEKDKRTPRRDREEREKKRKKYFTWDLEKPAPPFLELARFFFPALSTQRVQRSSFRGADRRIEGHSSMEKTGHFVPGTTAKKKHLFYLGPLSSRPLCDSLAVPAASECKRSANDAIQRHSEKNRGDRARQKAGFDLPWPCWCKKKKRKRNETKRNEKKKQRKAAEHSSREITTLAFSAVFQSSSPS